MLLVQIYLEEVCGWYALEKEKNYTGLFFYRNKDRFLDVSLDEIRDGDIFLFGPKGLIDFHKLHLAVFVAEYNDQEQPLLLHATNHKKLIADNIGSGIVLTPLDKMKSFKKYEVLYGIRRLR